MTAPLLGHCAIGLALLSLFALSCGRPAPPTPRNVATARPTIPTDPSPRPSADAPVARGSAPLVTEEPTGSALFVRELAHDFEYRVRSRAPKIPTFDGNIDEWLDGRAAVRESVLVVTLDARRFWVAFDVTEHGSFLSVELGLPGGELPAIGALVNGGGTHEVNCEAHSWSGEALLAAERRLCEEISRRYIALQRSHADRFRTRLTLNLSNLTWTRGAKNEPIVPTHQRCARSGQSVSCEVEWPLTALPRTNQNDVATIALRAALDPQQAPSDNSSWVSLPEPVAFEPGLELRRLLLLETETNFGENPQYSYQPGSEQEYEIAERTRPANLRVTGAAARNDWIADVSIVSCRPGAILARHGAVALRRSCGKLGEGLIFVGDVPTATFEWGRATAFHVRQGKLHAISETRAYEPDSTSEVAAWVIQAIAPDGARDEPILLEMQTRPCMATRASHNREYSTLTLGCLKPGGGRGRWITTTWVWSDAHGTYLQR